MLADAGVRPKAPEYSSYGLVNLAELYRAQDKYAEVEPLYERALAILEKALGSDHPVVANALFDLAVLYDEQGKYEEAEPLYRRALDVHEKALGPDHPDVALVLYGLARLINRQRRFEEAEPFYVRALAIENDLADLLFNEGNHAEAEAVYNRVWETTEDVFGFEHQEVAKILNKYVVLLRTMGKLETASLLEARATEIWAINAKAANWDIGLAALKAGEHAAALEAWLPLAHQGNPELQSNVATSYVFLGNDEEALKWWHRAAEQGHAHAEYSIGTRILNGDAGLPQDSKKAAIWLQRAAEKGHKSAQYNLGLMYFTGNGVQQDYVQAHMWFELSASGYQAAIDEGFDFDLKMYKKDAERMSKKAAGKLSRTQREEVRMMLNQWTAKSK